MRRINLDFHKANVTSNTRAGLLLLLLGLLSAIWMASIQNDIKSEQRRINTELSQRQNLSSPNLPARAEEFQKAILVIEQLSFPWNRLFQAIEENTGEDMALLSIQPDMAAKTIMLDAEAKDWGGMVSYIKRLEEDRFFSDVHVVSHQTQQSDPERPVRFRLSCTWIEPASAPSPTPVLGQ